MLSLFRDGTIIQSVLDVSGEPNFGVRQLNQGVQDMRGSMIFAFLFTALWSSQAWAEDDYVGAFWSVKVRSEKADNWVDFGVIRCTTDGKVYAHGKVIGSHKNKNLNNVEMKITAAEIPTRNGTWKATRVKKDGGVWGGVYKRKSDGKEFQMVLTLKKD